MRKKILIFANCSSGLFDFRKELIMTLIQAGHVVKIYTPFDWEIEELKSLGAEVVETVIDRRGLNPCNDLKLFKFYWEKIKTETPDLVITYTIKPNIYGGLACRLRRIAYATNITGLGTAFQKEGWLKTMVTFMYRIGCKAAETVFFENVENMQSFLERKIVNEKQACLLNGAGVNLEYFSEREYPANDMLHFLFIGRVMKEKGIDELFLAMKMLIKDQCPVKLDVLGEYEEDYKEKVEKYELEGWLQFHGFQNDVRPYIEQAHCFVLPSWHEGMANTNLECAAMARPVITSNIHGCLEAVEDGVTGYLCEKQDVDSLYETMKKFTKLSYEERKEMGLAGRRRMEKMFDKRNVVAKTIEALM